MENVLWFLGQPRQKKELERNNRKSTVLIALLQKCGFQFDFFLSYGRIREKVEYIILLSAQKLLMTRKIGRIRSFGKKKVKRRTQ